MSGRKKLWGSGVLVGAALILSSCAGVRTSAYSYGENYAPNVPVKAEGCYDAAVLLDKSVAESREIGKKVLVAIDSTLREETATTLKAQRNRHIGVFVGSGGEELVIALQELPGNKTFVTVATKTGFVGGAGQKAWSCQVIDQIVTLASK